jgi:hypothetical protein
VSAQSSRLSWPRPLLPAAGAALGLMLDVCAPHGPAKLPAAFVAGVRVAWVAGRWWWRSVAVGAARHGVTTRASFFGLDSQVGWPSFPVLEHFVEQLGSSSDRASGVLAASSSTNFNSNVYSSVGNIAAVR